MWTSLKNSLSELFAHSFEAEGFDRKFGEVTVSDRPDLAQFQCNGALGAAKSLKKNPREVAQKILERVQASAQEKWGVAESPLQLSIAGPGFINIVCSDSSLAQWMERSRLDDRLGVGKAPRSRKVVVDFGGPNVAKEMHVGHLRSSIIGDSLVRLHRFMGDEVIGDNHLGDWGTPMGMVLCELKREQPSLPYYDPAQISGYPAQSPVTMDDLARLYPIASKRFKEEPEFQAEVLRATDELQKGRPGYLALWKHFVDTTIASMNRDFGELGIQFDVWLGESFYENKMPPMVERLKAQGHAVLSEGAWIVPLSTESEPDAPPLILVKSGGGFLYHTSDLATIEYRNQHFHADLALYVVDKRQSLHFKQVFTVARKTGIAPESLSLVHAPFGTMNGPDGKPFKTRSGGVLKLRELIQMVNEEAKKRLAELALDRDYSPEEREEIAKLVGIATLKYTDLKNNRAADYIFDLERFSQFEGNTGPYLLYAAVRIKSILRKAAEQGLAPGAILPSQGHPERQLMLELAKFPDVIYRAYQAEEPHHLCDYGFALSQSFNFFYKECHILREPDALRQASWLGLAQVTLQQLELSLELLGIRVPNRM